MEHNDEPAFPRDHRHDGHNGLFMRDYFAAAALPALVEMSYRVDSLQTKEGQPVTEDDLATQAYHFADAMIKARSQS